MSDQVVVELHQRYPFDLVKVEKLLRDLSPDGFWPDLNYADTKRSGWEPKQHAERILELAKLYRSPNTAYYQSGKVASAIHQALHYWFTAKPVCLNWWYNQIGIPKTLGAAFILFEDQLTEKEKVNAIEVMQHADFGMTGQNKVWLAGNVMIRGLLQDDPDLVKAARDTIVSEITLNQPEGIKGDWSFHQHGPQQQFGNYGLSFISGMSFFSGIFAGTSLTFTDEQLAILSSFIEEGYRWVIWRGYMDISSLGRQLFHNAPVHKAFGLAFAASELAKTGNKSCEKAANDLISDNFPPGLSGSSFTGHKYFWDSDYTIHRNPQWMASVKMASERVIGAELVNEDNLKGYYLADGATYVYCKGDEYLNAFPFWDWRKIPGITAYESELPVPRLRKNQSRNETGFVGGVTDGHCGMTVMDFNRDGLKARKAWVFSEDFILCLGAGIRSDSNLVVTTAVDQRLKCNDLLYLNSKQWEVVKEKTEYSTAEQRFFHDNTGYILLQGNRKVAGTEIRTGQWHDFMQMYRPVSEKGEMISIYIDHGIAPVDANYQYIILPATDKQGTASFDLSKVDLIRNDQVVQAVFLSDTYWITAYEPAEMKLSSDLNLVIGSPGIYMIRKIHADYKITYTDPTHLLPEVSLTVNHSEIKQSLPEETKGRSVLLN